ncbi:MAG: methyltransferase domain-containing protein [Patescibacteria group bacterium]|jgi:SAM-dependent methyltransferase
MNTFLADFVKQKYPQPGKVLDLGAGDFTDVKALEKVGWLAEGVDKNLGVDLEQPFISVSRPFDLVYSNYLLHKLQNRDQLIKTACNNLKSGGWLFLHTFDAADTNSHSDIDADKLKLLLAQNGFINVTTEIIDFFDNDPGHQHWHKILQGVGQKV